MSTREIQPGDHLRAELIGKACHVCDEVITADHEEAHYYYVSVDENTRLEDSTIPVCCHECHYEVSDARTAAIAEMRERFEY